MSSQTMTVHPVDEKLPVAKLTALGLQHVMVMYAGAVAVPVTRLNRALGDNWNPHLLRPPGAGYHGAWAG